MFRQVSCASHSDDNTGNTYDWAGHICKSLSADDRVALAAGLSLCGVILLAVISLWVGKYAKRSLKRRARDREMSEASTSAPLINGRNEVRFSMLSKRTSQSSFPSSDHHQDICEEPKPPVSNERRESFHFPMLDANGALLPPIEIMRPECPATGSPTYSPRPLPETPILATPTTPIHDGLVFEGLSPLDDYYENATPGYRYGTRPLPQAPVIGYSPETHKPQSATIYHYIGKDASANWV